MTVSFDTPAPWVECFSCGYKRPLEQALFDLASEGRLPATVPLEYRQMKLDSPIVIPKSTGPTLTDYSIPLKDLLANEYAPEMVSFLKTKGISERVARAFRMAYVPPGHSDEWMGEDREGNPRVSKTPGILLPIFSHIDNEWRCVGGQLRYLQGNFRYFALYKFNASRRLFGEQVLSKSKGQDVFLVEGPFDAAHICSEGMRAVGLLGTSLNKHKALLLASAEPKMVHILLDPDKAGTIGSQKAEVILREYGIPYTPHQAYKDPKQYTKADLQQLIL
jgi:DNA primase